MFGLPSSPALEASEADLLRMQINAVDGQGIGKDGAEKMSENRIALIYSFTDLKHRFQSLLKSYEMITGGKTFLCVRLRKYVRGLMN